jgi:hypothetical protein
MILPDYCDTNNCMVNNPDNYPNLCTACILLTVEKMKNMPEEQKNEIFYTFKDAVTSGAYDDFIDDCCKEGNMTLEEYKDLEDEIWNEILMEER